MHIKPGILLISAPSLGDPHFEKVVIVITEYNAKGAMGFVINKLFSRSFNELTEFKNSPSMPLFEGGPVENESLYFLHQRPDLIEESIKVNDTVYMGGNFKQAVQHMNNKSISEQDIKLFTGYCGWDPGQLEEEIKEGSWLIVNKVAHDIFANDVDVAALWEDIYNQIK